MDGRKEERSRAQNILGTAEKGTRQQTEDGGQIGQGEKQTRSDTQTHAKTRAETHAHIADNKPQGIGIEIDTRTQRQNRQLNKYPQNNNAHSVLHST
jgi:hypothetical protein